MNSNPQPDPRKIHAAQLIHAVGLLTAYGIPRFLVDPLTAKAFRLSRLAIDDERRWGGGR